MKTGGGNKLTTGFGKVEVISDLDFSEPFFRCKAGGRTCSLETGALCFFRHPAEARIHTGGGVGGGCDSGG